MAKCHGKVGLMEKRKPEEYAFPCSLVRAGEKKILGQADLEKLVDCKTVNQAMSILGDFGYGDGRELSNPRAFDEVLGSGLEEAFKMVFSAAPDREELELFIYPGDYHNIKALLKAEALDIDGADYLTGTGKFDKETMERMIREREFVFMETAMKQGVNEALDVFAKGNDPQEIDIILDRACYRHMLSKAEETENEFLIGYVKLLIDILNVNSFVRLRKIGKPDTFFKKVFLAGGNIEEKVFLASWEDSVQKLTEKMAPFGFKEAFGTGAAEASMQGGNFTSLERITDNMRMKYIKNAKYISFGIEPLAAYLVAKEAEVKNLRMILTGIVTETPRNITLERLRVPYV